MYMLSVAIVMSLGAMITVMQGLPNTSDSVSSVAATRAESIASNFITFHQAALQYARQNPTSSGGTFATASNWESVFDDLDGSSDGNVSILPMGYNPHRDLLAYKACVDYTGDYSPDTTSSSVACSDNNANRYVVTYMDRPNRIDVNIITMALGRLSDNSYNVGVVHRDAGPPERYFVGTGQGTCRELPADDMGLTTADVSNLVMISRLNPCRAGESRCTTTCSQAGNMIKVNPDGDSDFCECGDPDPWGTGVPCPSNHCSCPSSFPNTVCGQSYTPPD